MSYGRLKEKEQALSAEIDDLIEKANRCDQEEDKTYQDKTGYEIPEDLQFKKGRLAKIKAAKQALEQREQQLNPGKSIDEKKQISFADTDARIMGKNGRFDYAYNAQHASMPTRKSLWLSMSAKTPTINRKLNPPCKRCKLAPAACQRN